MGLRLRIGWRVLAAALGMLASAPALSQPASQPLDDEAKTVVKMFGAAYGDVCTGIGDEGLQAAFPLESWPLSWTTEWSDTPETATLYKLFCFVGAYNATHIYYLASPDEWLGIQPVAFARPAFEVIYENGDTDGAVREIVLEGMVAEVTLVNSEFDPETGTMSDHGLWRGLGDASTVGTWRFHEGRFVLETFDVDASYDGNVSYERIVDFSTASGTP